MKKNTELLQYTDLKLQSHYQNDDEFNRKFNVMYGFYLNKFDRIINVDDNENFQDLMLQGIKSLFFNGYFIVQELLNHNENILEETFMTQPTGYLTESVPSLLRDAAGENFEEVIFTDAFRKVMIWAIKRYEDVRGTLIQIAFDIASLGAVQAIQDEANRRGLQFKESEFEGFLGQIDNYTFINPQLYLEIKLSTLGTEVWNLNLWSTFNVEDNKVGEINVIEINREQDKSYMINVCLKNTIREHERLSILETLIFRLMERKSVSRSSINMQIAIVEDFFILIPNT